MMMMMGTRSRFEIYKKMITKYKPMVNMLCKEPMRAIGIKYAMYLNFIRNI